jgi:hypothetical protein
VADRAHREIAREEVRDDAGHVRVRTDVLGRSAAGDHQRVELLGAHVGERDVHGELVAGLLGVGVPTRLEVVHHQFHRTRRRRGHDGLVAALTQAEHRVHRVEFLRGIPGQYQYPSHDELLSLQSNLIDGFDSSRGRIVKKTERNNRAQENVSIGSHGSEPEGCCRTCCR